MNTQKKIKKSDSIFDYTLGIQIGSVCFALKCKDMSDYYLMKQLYCHFLTEQPADITIELETTDRLNPDDLAETLSHTIFTHEGGNSFRTSSHIVAGQYNLNSRVINIIAERSLGDPLSKYNYLNRLVSLAYYTACKVKYDGNPLPAMLVHACGILRYGQAIIFAGPSETGKTSIARLCGKQHGEVINDEILLVSWPTLAGNNGIRVQSAPIIGGIAPYRNISAPLRYILLLKRSGRTLVRYLDKAEAYLRFMRQIIAPAYIGQKSGKDVYSLMASFSAELVRNVPIYELEFNLDGETLWQVLMELEGVFERRDWNC